MADVQSCELFLALATLRSSAHWQRAHCLISAGIINHFRNLSPSLSVNICKRAGNSKHNLRTSQLALTSRTALRARAAHWSWVSSQGSTSGFVVRILERATLTCGHTSIRVSDAADNGANNNTSKRASQCCGGQWGKQLHE